MSGGVFTQPPLKTRKSSRFPQQTSPNLQGANQVALGQFWNSNQFPAILVRILLGVQIKLYYDLVSIKGFLKGFLKGFPHAWDPSTAMRVGRTGWDRLAQSEVNQVALEKFRTTTQFPAIFSAFYEGCKSSCTIIW